MGPLAGKKIVEIAGLGPCPIAGMMLADLGAEVILVERAREADNMAPAGAATDSAFFRRGKQSITLDLKDPADVEVVLSLVEQSDVLIEGFRPGVTERLGLGPEPCLERNPSLVYGRMTGWGQTGPLSQSAGHDMNYLAISGALHYEGLPDTAPYPVPTVMGDVGSGSNIMVIGILAALLHAQNTGEGQVVDAAVVDGAIYNMALLASIRAEGAVSDGHRRTWGGGSSHFCHSYVCADGRYITVQALEPNFYRELISVCGLGDDAVFCDQYNPETWPAAKAKMAALFASQPQSHWCELLSGTDACFAPVLSLTESAENEHVKARGCFLADELQPAPAPRFSITRQEVGKIPSPGEHNDMILLASKE